MGKPGPGRENSSACPMISLGSNAQDHDLHIPSSDREFGIALENLHCELRALARFPELSA
jgi:hypothetical protein